MLSSDSMVFAKDCAGALVGQIVLSVFQLLSAEHLQHRPPPDQHRCRMAGHADLSDHTVWTLRISLIAYAEGSLRFTRISSSTMCALLVGQIPGAPSACRSLQPVGRECHGIEVHGTDFSDSANRRSDRVTNLAINQQLSGKCHITVPGQLTISTLFAGSRIQRGSRRDDRAMAAEKISRKPGELVCLLTVCIRR